MLKLTDVALEHVKNFATPIPPWRRSEYLDAVASALAGVRDPGDGTVYKAARTAQQKILYGGRRCDGPVLDGRTGMPLSPREQFTMAAATNPRFKQAPRSNGDGVVIFGARPK